MQQRAPIFAWNLARALGQPIDSRTPWRELQLLCGMVVCEAANSGDLPSKIELCVAFREACLSTLVVADIDEHVDGTGQFSGLIEQRCWIGDEKDARAIRALSYRFHATDRSSLMQRDRHRALIVRQRRAIWPVELPGPAELALAELGAAAPKRGRRLVVDGEAPLWVRHVDSSRKYLDRFSGQTVYLIQGICSCLAVGRAWNLWLCPDPSQCSTPSLAIPNALGYQAF